mgnify:CR=1 FL=1
MNEIFGLSPKAGQKYFRQILVGKLANGADVMIPFLLLKGAKDGPFFWINGAVHGAELNGSVAAWELFQELDPAQVKGTLAVTPVANALGFQRRDKISDLDFQDMDTSFPGKPNGKNRICHIQPDQRTCPLCLEFSYYGAAMVSHSVHGVKRCPQCRYICSKKIA